MLGRAGFHLAGHAAEPFSEKLAQIPAGAVRAEKAQVMKMQVAGLMSLANLFGIDLMEPVLLREGFADVVVHAVDGFLGIGVFLHAPVVVPHIVGKHLDGGADESVGLPGAAALFAIEDIGLGGFGMAVFDQNLFHQILNGLHVHRSIGILLCRQGDNLVREILGHGPIFTTYGIGSLEDGTGDFFGLEGDHVAVALANGRKHKNIPLYPKYCSPYNQLYTIYRRCQEKYK